MLSPHSLRELAVVTGLTRSQVRSAVEDGLVCPATLTWADALALRVQLPIQSMLLAGESRARNASSVISPRTREAVRLVRDVAETDQIGRDALLIVGRASASVQPSLQVAALEVGGNVYHDGVMLAFPIGQWWSELRWRRTPEGAESAHVWR